MLERLKNLNGTIVPITTPFEVDHSINFEALKTIVRFYLDHGFRSFIAAGSTGQCSALTIDEHERVVRTIADVCREYDNTFVLGGCSHTSTAMSNKLAAVCKQAGADGLLLTPPYYQTHQDMCMVHYLSVARNNDLPLVVYHNDDLLEDLSVWDELVKEPNILGVKYATDNLYFARELIARYRGRLGIFGGGTMLQFLALYPHGPLGYVGSYCNFIPEIEVTFMERLQNKDLDLAARIAELEFDLFAYMGSGNWFNYLVALINACDLPGGYCRPPLPDWTRSDQSDIRSFLDTIKARYAELVAQ